MGRPHGLDGSFRVNEARAALLREGTEVKVGDETAVIERRAGTDASPIVRLRGCGDRDAAEALRGQDIRVVASEAPSLGPDEWWAEELVGCRVVDGARPVGVVRRLVALPSCEALDVERPAAPALLVPLVADAIRAVDVEARRIDIDLAFVEPGAGP